MQPFTQGDLATGVPSTSIVTSGSLDSNHRTGSTAWLAAIVESSEDAIIGEDLQGTIRTWNKAAERLFGYHAHEIVGQPLSILVGPDQFDEMSSILVRIQKGEVVQRHTTVCRRKDGRIIPISLSVSPLRNEAGAIIGAANMARDISAGIPTAEQISEGFDAPLRLLSDATGALLASPHTTDVLQNIVSLAQRFGSADAYAVWRKRQSDAVWVLIISSGLSPEYVQAGTTQDPGTRALRNGPLAFEDVSKEPFLATRRDALNREGVRSMLVVPLQVQGEPTGTISFYWKSPHRFTDFELRIASALGNMAAAALGTAELYERELDLRRQAQVSEQRSAFLAEAGAVLAGSLDYQTTLRSVARLAIARFADWCAVDLCRDGDLERVALEHIEPSKIELAREYRKKYPLGDDDLSLVALRTGEPVLIESIPDEVLVERIPDSEQLQMVRAMGIRSLMITPMVTHGRTLGLLTFVSSKPDQHYTKPDLALAQELARRAAMAIDNARLYADVRASEARYRSLVSATSSVVWTIDPAGKFTEPQASWETYTGQTWEEHRGLRWLRAIHPEDRNRIVSAWLRCRDTAATYEAEGRLWNAQAESYRYFIARATPVRDETGSICEWIGTVTDIHERKQAEEERNALLAREQQARSTAQLLNRVGQLLSAELDPRSLAKRVTDLATKLVNAEFGALFHNVVGENGESYALYTVSGAPQEAFAHFPMPRNTAVFGPTFRGEGVVRSDDITKDPRYGKNAPYYGMPPGHLPVRSYLAVPVVSRSGDVLGGLFFGHSQPGVFQEQAEEFAVGIASQAAIALDNARLFAQSRNAQAALRRSNEELRRANDDLNRFAYSASHDLQEPLRMVSAYCQLLQKRYQSKLDRQADQYIAYAVEGAQRMEALVRDILAYTRATMIGDQDTGPTDTNAAIRKVLSNLQRAIEKSGAVIDFSDLPQLNVPEIHLVQLLQNLIGNAIKYTGENTPCIEISASRRENAWLFSVRDNGIGIDPQYKEQVFGLFKRLHTSAQYAGTGIGLAICQKIVERYGGRIWVESALGQGATFYFTIPDRDPPGVR